MSDEALLLKLAEVGVEPGTHAVAWSDAAELLAAFDAIGRVCSTAFVKIDGLREKNIYTVFLSGGPLGEDFFRKDGSDLRALLVEAIEFFIERSAGAS